MKTALWALLWAALCSVTSAAVPVPDEEDIPALAPLSASVARLTPVNRIATARSSVESAVVHFVRPRFPAEMRTIRMPGFACLEVTIDNAGDVVDLSVVDATLSPFAREAIRAVSQWKFIPSANAAIEHRRVLRVPIDFQLFVPVH